MFDIHNLTELDEAAAMDVTGGEDIPYGWGGIVGITFAYVEGAFEGRIRLVNGVPILLPN